MFRQQIRPIWVVMAFMACGQVSFAADAPQWTELIPRASRIVVGTADDTVDLGEAGQLKFTLQRALRGRGRKGESILVSDDGAPASPKFEKDQQYLLLLQPSPDNPETWTHLGAEALPLDQNGVQSSGAEGEAVSWESIFSMLDRYAADPQLTKYSRATLEGRWMATLASSPRYASLWILDIKKQDGDFDVQLLGFDSQFEEVEVDEFSVDGQMVTYQILAKEKGKELPHTFSFEGRFENGAVMGNYSPDQGRIRPGWLRPTAAKELSESEKGQLMMGNEEFADAVVAEDEFKAYEEFVEKYPRSPLALDSYFRMLQSETAALLPAEKNRQLADAFIATALQWGERMRKQSIVDAGVSIAARKAHPELALEYLTQAESFLNEDSPAPWKTAVPFQFALMLRDLGKIDEASERMLAFHKKHPFEPQAAYYAAQLLEKQEKFEEAMSIYAGIAMLPNLKDDLDQMMADDLNYVVPDKKFGEMWAKTHPGPPDRNAALLFTSNAYREAIAKVDPNPYEPRPAPEKGHNRVTLVELFTCTESPTGVGADLAALVVQSVFQPSEVIVMRYHIASVGPDPLIGPNNLDRLIYYKGRSTPITAINGQLMLGGGYTIHTPLVYQELRQLINPALEQTSNIELKISALGDPQKLSISAEVISDEPLADNLRLRLALAEEHIPFQAENGISLHEQVVRIMPGGVEGIAPQEGKLAFEESLDVEDYRKQLEDYLLDFEDAVANTKGEEFKLPIHPIGPGRLRLIAFVQNDDTKEVLQAASTLVLPREQKPAEKETTPPAEAEDSSPQE